MKKCKVLVLNAAIFMMVSTSSYGLGPVDGEIGVALWNNDFDADISEGKIDAGSIILHGQAWLGDKWGIKGAWFDSDLESQEFSNLSRLQLEVRRRFLSVSDNSYVALGGGIERIDLVNGSDTSGVRVSAEGRLGVGPAFVYGVAAWVPVLQDAANFNDISATEVDAGIHLTLIPFVSLRLGYLEYNLDYDDTMLNRSSGSRTSGFYLGAGLHW
jgi:hypothetical protein